MTTKPAGYTGNMRTFTILWFGQLVSALGSGLSGFALGVWIYERTSSVTMFTLVVLSFELPSVLFAPIAGALVDRWNRRIVLILCDTAAALGMLAVLFLELNNALEVWHIVVLSVIGAIAMSFQWPAFSAATTMLVPKEHLGRAGGMSQIGEAISRLFSPVLAGVLFLSIGLSGIVLIDLVTFLFAVTTMLLVSIPEPVRTQQAEGKPSLWKEIRFGWDYILKRPGLLILLLYIAGLNLGFGLTNPLFVPMVLEIGGPDELGLALSVMGLGSLPGTLIMSAWGGPRKRVYGVLGSGVLAGIAYFFHGVAPNLWVVAVAGFFFSLVLPVMMASSQALWQTKTAPDVQGRVFSIRRLIAQFTAPIGTVIAGPLVDQVLQPGLDPGGALAGNLGNLIGVGAGRGSAAAFLIVGAFIFVISIACFGIPRLRNVESEIPDVEIKVVEEPTAA
jgi:DHA3 family macrolide efflux protein-like MFS transporter